MTQKPKTVADHLYRAFETSGMGKDVGEFARHFVGGILQDPPEIMTGERLPYLAVGPDHPTGLVDVVYRAMARYYHPDNKHGTGNPDTFREVTEAYTEIKKLQDRK